VRVEGRFNASSPGNEGASRDGESRKAALTEMPRISPSAASRRTLPMRRDGSRPWRGSVLLGASAMRGGILPLLGELVADLGLELRAALRLGQRFQELQLLAQHRFDVLALLLEDLLLEA